MPLKERLEILVFLTTDESEEIRDVAFATLQQCTTEELRPLLTSPATPVSFLELAATKLAPGREDLLDILLTNPFLPEHLQNQIVSELAAPSGSPAESDGATALGMESDLGTAGAAPAVPATGSAQAPDSSAPETNPEEKEQRRETLLEKIGRLSAVEKIKLALTGNQESRLILIRDGNKIVARSVLQSPKVSDAEMEAFASMKNVSEEVLRLIAMNRAFIKTYAVVRALVNNPRAPIDVTLPLLPRLHDKDLKTLGLNRNVPEAIRHVAIKTIKAKEEATKPKLPGKKH